MNKLIKFLCITNLILISLAILNGLLTLLPVLEEMYGFYIPIAFFGYLVILLELFLLGAVFLITALIITLHCFRLHCK